MAKSVKNCTCMYCLILKYANCEYLDKKQTSKVIMTENRYSNKLHNSPAKVVQLNFLE